MSLLERVKAHEGFSATPYRDTVGKLTIGYGLNLGAGISERLASVILAHQLHECRAECVRAFPWFPRLTESRKEALIEMCFNLGMSRLKGFEKMLAAFARGDFVSAAAEALDSKWAAQVGKRAETIAEAIKEWR